MKIKDYLKIGQKDLRNDGHKKNGNPIRKCK